MATNMSKTQNCTNLTWHWYWTTNPVGATNTRSQKIQEHEIKHNTSTPYKPIKLHKQTNQLEHPVQQKQNTTHWTRIIKNNDKPDYSSWKQITTHTRQSHLPFLQTSLTNGIPSPTFLTRKVLNCFKKKQEKRERGRRVHRDIKRGPNPSGVNQEKEGERVEIRQLRIAE